MRHAILAIGILFLVFAALAYGYTVTETDSAFGGFFTHQDTTAPYRYLAIPLGIGGLVLIIVSAAMGREKVAN
jgi:hypothetical protein